tara:strand:- start:5554 stop:5694 length:141 start_codon:yes stop_codon:yes gene_type:complete
MEGLVDGVAQVGITIFSIVMGMLIVNWLDRNVFSNHKKFNKENEND